MSNQDNDVREIIIIGSGNWGLTLASLFCKNCATRVWTINSDMAKQIIAHRECPGEFFRYSLPEDIIVEEKYASRFEVNKTLFILAVPSSQVCNVSKELSLRCRTPFILSVSKGFDNKQQCTMSELIKLNIPKATVAVLSGPTIANEVVEGKPTRAVLACDDLIALVKLKEVLKNDVIFFEVGRNPAHHEICAALKGLVAIGVGIAVGLDLGANIQGILMTEGIRELGIVASFFGIPESVASGTSGASDLIATCVSKHSRNRRLGLLLAKGLSLEDSLEKVRMTVEGVAMSETIERLSSLDVSIPLIHMVNRIILGKSQNIRTELRNVIKVLGK